MVHCANLCQYTVLVKGMWVTKITTNKSNLRGTLAVAIGEVGIAELVVIRHYQAV